MTERIVYQRLVTPVNRAEVQLQLIAAEGALHVLGIRSERRRVEERDCYKQQLVAFVKE